MFALPSSPLRSRSASIGFSISNDADLVALGPYAIEDAGPYLESADASIFRLDADALLGTSHGNRRHRQIIVISMLPKNYYNAMGYDINAIQI